MLAMNWNREHSVDDSKSVAEFRYSDYNGALAAGMKALLLQRSESGVDREQAHLKCPEQESLPTGVQTAKNLSEVIQWVETYRTLR
jgi:hypothetical protein